MMKTRLVILTTIFVILLILSPLTVSAQTEGFIEGQLLNETESGSSTAGYRVILTTYLDDIETGTSETLTDENGVFFFNDLDMTPGYTYQVKTTFQSAEYYSDKLAFSESSVNLILILPVYDSTENDTDISVMSSHVIIYAIEGQLQVTEFYVFLNNSDHTYIGNPYSGNVSKRETLRLTLPPDAENLQIDSEFLDSYIELDSGGFVDTLPFQPGSRNVAFSYTSQLVEGEYSYIQDVLYPIGNIELFINGEVSITASEFMIRNEPFQSKGETFQHYSVSGVVPGQQLSLILTESSSDGTQISPFWIIIIVVLLIVAAYFVYYLRVRRRVIPQRGDDDDDVEELLRRIAGLDDDYENAIIDENEYHKLRDEYKNRLADLMGSSNGD